MSSSTSNYSDFNVEDVQSLLTTLRSDGDITIETKNVTEKEINLLPNFRTDNDFKGHNLRKLADILFDNYMSTPDRMTQHHIESYDHFISRGIPQIMRNVSPIIRKANYNKKIGKYLDEYHITFGNVYIGKPGIKEDDGRTKMMFPYDARSKNLPYSANLYLDVYQKYIKYPETKSGEPIIKEYEPVKKINLRSIPMLVKSKYCSLSATTSRSQAEQGECEYEQGGYFIIKGAEKVLIPQERKCENKILVFAHNKTQTAFSHTVEISSSNGIFSRSTQLKLHKVTSKGTIRVFIQRFKNDSPFPLFLVFRALNIISDKEIMEKILFDPTSPDNREAFNMLIPSIEEAAAIQTQEVALLKMASSIARLPEMKEEIESSELDYRKNYVLNLLKTELFPHIGSDFIEKACFLGMMAKKLIQTALGVKKYDDRDSFINKRVSGTGDLLKELFQNNVNKLVKDIGRNLESDMRQGHIDDIAPTIPKKVKNINIESSIRYSLGTGTWGMKSQASSAKKGIAQPLNRLSYTATLSHLRRINAPRAEKGGKIIEPRKLHSTQFGRCDPSETPDGAMVGIVKNMAFLCMISVTSSTDPVISVLREQKVTVLLDTSAYQKSIEDMILINGKPYGFTPEPEKIVGYLRSLRRKGILDFRTSVSWLIDDKQILIHTEGGRLLRPLYVVSGNRLMITMNDILKISNLEKSWDDLIYEGKIEYLDPQEENGAMIAMYHEDLLRNSDSNDRYVRYTHMEIHPSTIFGVSAGTIPFSDHNQAIRIMYQANQRKQALNMYVQNYRIRMDNPGQVLRSPQVPLTTTRMAKYLNERELPSGQNAIVAIMNPTGYNQEDSLIVNQSAIDRGFGRSAYYRTYKDSEKKNPSSLEEEKFGKPVKLSPNGSLKTAGTKSTSYSLLDSNGFAKIGSYVKGGDVIIGKSIPIKDPSGTGPKFRDASTTVNVNGDGIVDLVFSDKDSDGFTFVKVRIRAERIPGIGDKFSSRFGQKGTIGMTYTSEDLPFTSEGITPDIIVNPAAIPSRMTIGQLLESCVNKSACDKGFECDATPFSCGGFTLGDLDSDSPNTVYEIIAELLKDSGYREDGCETMFNGRNGRKEQLKIFIGVVFYQRLKHMSKDKLHARAYGPVQSLTRQPPEGRKRGGGFRFGEMERDCMLAYAASGFLKERFFECSDKYVFYVCADCGTISIANPSKKIFKCTHCHNSTDFKKIRAPYAFKLLLQELMGMGILLRMYT